MFRIKKAKLINTTKVFLVVIFVFSCFSYLEQPGYDLLQAAARDDVGMVGHLLSLGVSPDFRNDEFNRTPLHMAAFNNSTEVARLLITYKADIEARHKHNQTSLHVAAVKNSTEVAQLLITHKADIEARHKYNRTPLHEAAINNSAEVAQLLITHKADIEARNKNNRTPLHEAAINNSTEVAQLLITHKADMEAKDNDNRTPLVVACKSPWNTEAIIHLLMVHAANIS